MRGPHGPPKGTELRQPTQGQLKAIALLEASVGGAVVVQYNALTATPRHLFNPSGYLTPPSSAPAEMIARNFIAQWRGIWRFSDEDLENLRLKSRATLPEGTTIVLLEQHVDGISLQRGEVLVNVSRAGQIISAGSESFPQMTVSNSFAMSPAQAVTAGAAALGISYAPTPLGTTSVLRTFGDLPHEFTEGTRFSGGESFTDEIVVTRVIFPLGNEGRAAYQFALTTPQWDGMMWDNIVDAETGAILRRYSLTSFQQGGGPVNNRRGTFRPDIQDFVEGVPTTTGSGKVFDGGPTMMSGRGGIGRPTRAQLPKQPTYAADTATTGDERTFRRTAVKNRVEYPFADSASELLFPQVYNTPFGQATRGFPNALNPTPQSPFGWFYLPTSNGGAEIGELEATTNYGPTRAFGYTIHPLAKTRNAVNPGNSPTGNGEQPFSASLTDIPDATLLDGRVLSSVFESNYTEGNNVLAADDKNNDNETTHGIKGYSANRQFTAGYFDFASTYEIDNQANPDVFAGTLTLFYYNNVMHDYFYDIGFTEATWNFQQDNFGKGGAGNDAVSLQVQDGSGTNNANFSTGNDGTRPRMQMYLFTDQSFGRRADGDFDFDIVAHELFHGVSNRSVGKGSGSCLGITLVGEANGMGEGWSDYIAASMSDDDSPAEYATGDMDKAIRHLPYTNYRYSYGSIPGNYRRRDQLPLDNTDAAHVLQGSNPLIPFEVHDIGEYWAATLWDMRELFIVKQDVDDDPNTTNFAGMFFDGGRRIGGGTNFYIGYRQVQSIDTRHPIDYRSSFNNGNVASVNSALHVIRPPELTAEIQMLGHRNGPKATAVRRGARLADIIMMRGMQLAPCNPSFVDMRDSMLLADTELNGGENRALIWRAFASHGVGLLAASSNATVDTTPGSQNVPVIVEDFTVPPGVSQCEATGPLPPPAFTLSTPSDNTVRLSIPAVTGGHTKTISRGTAANGPFMKIADIPNATTTYDDTQLSGGTTYFYQVRVTRPDTTVPVLPMANPNCVSGTNTAGILVNGPVIIPDPIFFGVTRVSDVRDGSSLNVSWFPAFSPTPQNIVYDVYRVDHVDHTYTPLAAEPEPSFVPSAANRIAQGLTGTSFIDSGRTLNHVYYYIVQARDTVTGRKDTNNAGNTAAKWSAPTIPCFTATPPFPLETFEAPTANSRFNPPLTESGNTPNQGSATFQRVTGVNLGGGVTTGLMYAPDFDPGSDGAASDFSAIMGPLTLTATSIMEFDHFFRTETAFDGGVIEIAIGGPNFNSTPYPDNATTFDLGDYMIEGGYNNLFNGTLAADVFLSPLQGRRGFTGTRGLHHTRISLKNFAPGGLHNPAGAQVFIRFRMSSDVQSTAGPASGWYIDNVVINNMSAGGPAAVQQVVSRKLHQDAGNFDVPLPLTGNPGIECRRGSGANDGDHTLIFRFASPLSSVGGASVTSGMGSVSSSFIDADARQYVVNLTGVTNEQTITVTLTGVNSICGTSPSIAVPMGVFLGDTNGDRSVNSGDAMETRNRSGQNADATTFRSDVNVDGTVNSGDAFIVRGRSGDSLDNP